MNHNENTKRGFTLVELMIVVAIIGVIAGIAIPNMLRARVEANEASAIGDLRVIGAAEITYNSTKYTYADFAALATADQGPGTALLTDDWVEGRTKNGYTYTMPQADSAVFVCFADPVVLGTTGTRFFRVDQSGIVRSDPSGQPENTDPPVGG